MSRRASKRSLAILRGRAAELQTLIIRLANLVAKANGRVNKREVNQLNWIRAECKRVLQPIPLASLVKFRQKVSYHLIALLLQAERIAFFFQCIFLILSEVLIFQLLLDFLGEHEAATLLMRAIEEVLARGQVRTPDLRGTATTRQMGQAVREQVKSMAA